LHLYPPIADAVVQDNTNVEFLTTGDDGWFYFKTTTDSGIKRIVRGRIEQRPEGFGLWPASQDAVVDDNTNIEFLTAGRHGWFYWRQTTQGSPPRLIRGRIENHGEGMRLYTYSIIEDATAIEFLAAER
jgi:hypothetical protein